MLTQNFAAAYIFSDKKNNRLFVLFQLKMSMRKEHPPERRFVSIKLEDFDEGETFQDEKADSLSVQITWHQSYEQACEYKLVNRS